MKSFEPEALVAAMLDQLNLQPQWQAWTAANNTMGTVPHFVDSPALSTVPVVADLSAHLGGLDAIFNQITHLLNEFGSGIEPQVIKNLQQEYIEKITELWKDMLQSKTPVLEDRRFKSPEWHNSSLNAYSAASYLLNRHYLIAIAQAVQAPEHRKQKLLFSIEQLVDAMSPANFLATNPEAISKLIASQGESLTKGMANMFADLQKGHISLTDETAFEVGRNVATTPGQVIYENHVFQLIQYQPLQANVYQRPLLMVPPCINKFYILDLQPNNSLVKFALEQGHSVFLISWVNPHEKLGYLTWDNYVDDGVIKAIHSVQAVTGEDKINTLGFCVGGTLLTTALAVMAARGEQPAASITLLTTLLDFDNAGALEVFVDEVQVGVREKMIGQGGLMSGRDLSNAFSSLRSNDLVWHYVQKNYLKGEEPTAFDLLYWNSDATNLPGPMFCWYLRNMYLENNLKQPEKLTVAGEKIDLGKINAPVFVYASREDHIVPWSAAYASLALLNPKKPSKNRFVLGASGHIAGVINPPAKMKRNYWSVSEQNKNAEKKSAVKSMDQWLDGAKSHPGSWWPEWTAFLAENAGKKVKAKMKMGNMKHQTIEAAPGRYVKVKC
ncbi:MAG: poly(R)-hydroxyalkanoic acid synthase [Solimicrobium sp.]|nr:poly(R)-hydroxyalkanoic acid synthase [Solimicrobium sp.]